MRSIACGWSPAGLKGASTRKLEGIGEPILGRTGVRVCHGEPLVRRRYFYMKDQIEGKANELKGKMTGDKSEELEGKAQQKMGDVKEKVRDAREDVKDEAEKQRELEHAERSDR
jgi:uncharacterized protein YjbJ (UPF0337 family)